MYMMYHACTELYIHIIQHLVSLIVECEPGEVRLYNEASTGSNGVEGIAQYCSDGVWTALCDDGTNSNDGIDIICQGLYYEG